MNPAIRLQTHLRNAPPTMREALIAAGIDLRLIRRAVLGQPVNANIHLRLCALLGFDPVTGNAMPPRTSATLHKPSLSAALRIKRIQDKLTLRQAARKAKVSYSTLGRIERGEDVSIDAILAACGFLDRHPFDFVSPDVPRETRTETRRAA